MEHAQGLNVDVMIWQHNVCHKPKFREISTWYFPQECGIDYLHIVSKHASTRVDRDREIVDKYKEAQRLKTEPYATSLDTGNCSSALLPSASVPQKGCNPFKHECFQFGQKMVIDSVERFREVYKDHLNTLPRIQEDGNIILCAKHVHYMRHVWYKTMLCLFNNLFHTR